ncbi:MAG: ADP-ribosylglycohydrolase family protein [Candidatus Hydrogenedentes bacterium]|nr:ADP-ribosylglycohydrolase family protein [Candidatus Hydrogenedentota bacterium]
MPYYPKLQQLLTDVSHWADLRTEQGSQVRALMARLEKTLEKTGRELSRLRPTTSQLEKEPNDLRAIRALRPEGPRRLWKRFKKAGLRSRLKGAWLGRAAGCTLGAPVEGWSPERMERLARRCNMDFPPRDYWSDHPDPDQPHYETNVFRDYLRGYIKSVPVDDDLTYTLLGLLILEEFGPAFTTKDVGTAWLKYLPVACTAEDVALKNLKAGIPATRTGEKANPFQEWIGADIRSDPWGYAAPGWPEKAAEMAYRDAYLSHRQNGIYGAMFFSAAIAAAFALNDPVQALEVGLTEIPKDCRLARDVRCALKLGPRLKDWRAARHAVDEQFAGMHPVHTNNNACLTIFGLMLGGGDFTRTIGATVAMGLDNDCTAATAGSILGATIGIENIPEHWWKPFHNKTRTYINGHEWFRNTEICERFQRMADALWHTR